MSIPLQPAYQPNKQRGTSIDTHVPPLGGPARWGYGGYRTGGTGAPHPPECRVQIFYLGNHFLFISHFVSLTYILNLEFYLPLFAQNQVETKKAAKKNKKVWEKSLKPGNKSPIKPKKWLKSLKIG